MARKQLHGAWGFDLYGAWGFDLFGGEESRGAQKRAKADDGHQHINSVGVHKEEWGDEEEKGAVISVARGGGEAWGGETSGGAGQAGRRSTGAVAAPRRATHAREHGTCSRANEGKQGPRDWERRGGETGRGREEGHEMGLVVRLAD
ncbi:hypothetical protein ZEAMMB73_Zm00001d021905 [Zea mays]|jgi:hypothetical protein|uniref:Uncharacterized protein n=1 Tax=Zea mays TaxID=4577 RepID=A0A1D6IHS2_MAIZE|nr:hypothetical protein ZEAMMB73_Zm00001d021905 [Zea mays]